MVKKFVFFMLSLVVISCVCAAPLYAEESELVIAGPAGKIQQVFYEYALEFFKVEYPDVEVSYLPESFSMNPALVGELQEASFAADILIANDAFVIQATDRGLFARLDVDRIPNYGDLYPYAAVEGDYGVVIGIIATGIAYSTEAFNNNSFSKPSTWEDLYVSGDDGLEKHKALPDISTLYGWQNLTIAASFAGESYDLNAGIGKLKELNPFFITKSSVELLNLFEEGKVWISPWGSSTVLRLIKEHDLPIQFVYPEKDIPLLRITVSKFKNTRNSELADRFIGILLSEEFQQKMVSELYWGPANSRVELEGLEAQILPYGQNVVEELPIDWSFIKANMIKLTETWSELFY